MPVDAATSVLVAVLVLETALLPELQHKLVLVLAVELQFEPVPAPGPDFELPVVGFGAASLEVDALLLLESFAVPIRLDQPLLVSPVQDRSPPWCLSVGR